MLKKDLGQFFSTNAVYIMQELLTHFPKTATIVDPFAGNWDLLHLFSTTSKEGYDIDVKNANTIQRDTLKNSLHLQNKWVITNPPYLAKNKAKNKKIFEQYATDDLYKCALLSIMSCEGGAIILPLNFFSSEDTNIRRQFLSNFKIIRLNVFEERVFADTDYTVCAFNFVKEKNSTQTFSANFFPSKKKTQITLSSHEGYSIGHSILKLKQAPIKIGRLLKTHLHKKTKLIPSSLFLFAVDSGTESGKIRLEMAQHFYGKATDRAFATLCFDRIFSKEQEARICQKFNEKLTAFREEYHNLFLTNYRNSSKHYARKRISFELAYALVLNIIDEEQFCFTPSLNL